MPESQRNDTLAQIKRDLIYIGQHASDPPSSSPRPDRKRSATWTRRFLDISGDGVNMRWYVDPQTGRVLRETYHTVGRSGPVEDETDLRRLEDRRWSYPSLRAQEQAERRGFEHVAVHHDPLNPAVDPKLFDKPAAETKKPQ